VEEMQPLYYFNVKPALKSETEEDEEKPSFRPKEASTPFFLGSPVNIAVSHVTEKKMNFQVTGYESFGED
jgi:hypothetical protein